jgi:hypothetical protein
LQAAGSINGFPELPALPKIARISRMLTSTVFQTPRSLAISAILAIKIF